MPCRKVKLFGVDVVICDDRISLVNNPLRGKSVVVGFEHIDLRSRFNRRDYARCPTTGKLITQQDVDVEAFSVESGGLTVMVGRCRLCNKKCKVKIIKMGLSEKTVIEDV